jgi:phage shock protein A
MARDGSIGKATFERVEQLTAEGGNKSDAFAQIAKETGKNVGTVSAAYYRVARASGTVKPRRRRRARTTTAVRAEANGRRTRARSAGGSDVDKLAADLVKSVTALADAVKAQQVEVTELRGRLDGVKALLG